MKHPTGKVCFSNLCIILTAQFHICTAANTNKSYNLWHCQEISLWNLSVRFDNTVTISRWPALFIPCLFLSQSLYLPFPSNPRPSKAMTGFSQQVCTRAEQAPSSQHGQGQHRLCRNAVGYSQQMLTDLGAWISHSQGNLRLSILILSTIPLIDWVAHEDPHSTSYRHRTQVTLETLPILQREERWSKGFIYFYLFCIAENSLWEKQHKF